MRATTATFAILPFAANVAAWGGMGHMTIALIGENYLTAGAKAWVSNLLGDTMANVATWPDSYRYTAEGAWSAHLHYVDANDAPPNTCGVILDRDCEDGCIVTAIANFTKIAGDKTMSIEERQMALKFLIHFHGDVTQPLHNEALDIGGNTINVTWAGSPTNLHAAWDRNIPQTIAGGDTITASRSWSKKLIADIDSGIYATESASWTSCSDITTAEDCALSWAIDANSHVCSDVLAGGVDAVENHDISTDYYQKAAPIVSEQIAKGGYRLGMWLNNIYASQKMECQA